mgnify:CR=1 FL=1
MKSDLLENPELVSQKLLNAFYDEVIPSTDNSNTDYIAQSGREKGLRYKYLQFDAQNRNTGGPTTSENNFKKSIYRLLFNLSEIVKNMEKRGFQEMNIESRRKFFKKYDIEYYIKLLDNLENQIIEKFEEQGLKDSHIPRDFHLWSPEISYALAQVARNRRNRFDQYYENQSNSTNMLLNFIYFKNYNIDGKFFKHLTQNLISHQEILDIEETMALYFDIFKTFLSVLFKDYLPMVSSINRC